MNQLIRITNDGNGQKVGSARELYLGLGLAEKEWSRWYKRNIESNEYFLENVDWVGFRVNDENSKGGRPTQDFIITLEFAKHICMMARTDKSHEYRNYLLECEKQIQQQKTPQTYLEALEALVESEKEKQRLLEQKQILLEQNQILEEENMVMAPKAEYFDDLVDRNLLTNFRDTAKELHVKQNKFMNFLETHNYIYRDIKNDPKPYATHVKKGLFEIKEFVGNNGYSGTQTLITAKGRETFRLLLSNNDEEENE